jgi:hypothetical protein
MVTTYARVYGITAAFVLQQPNAPNLRDRGPGVRTSEFQTYVARHQLLLLTSAAYIRDHNLEYNPLDWGYGSQEGLRASYRSSEAQLVLAYGITDWLGVELQGSNVSARFERSPSDTSATPARIRESGFGDFAGQVRVRLAQEHGRRPEIFGAVEVIPAAQRGRVLIGDAHWDVNGEIGVVRGFGFGTMTLRTTIEYNHGDSHWDLGETSLEYLRRLSTSWRVLLAIEGGETGALDEWTFVTAGQWRIANGCYVKFANGFGLMSKSTDWEPQVGLLFEVR